MTSVELFLEHLHKHPKQERPGMSLMVAHLAAIEKGQMVASNRSVEQRNDVNKISMR